MGRPRNPFYRLTSFDPLSVRWLADTAPGVVGTRAARRFDAALNWGYPTRNGTGDPLTYFLVLGALVNVNPSVEVRAKNLAEYLQLHFPQIAWDAVTVGRVLSDLCDNLEDVNGRKNAFLEVKRSSEGNYYYLHRTPDASKTALALLADLYRLCEIEMAVRKQGKKTDYPEGPLMECPSVLVEAPRGDQ